MVSLVLWLRPPLMETHSVIDSNKSDEYNRKYIVTDEIDLKNGKELISFFKDSGQFDNHKLSQKNSSVSIALAVTAYARIHMSLAPRAPPLKQIAIDSGLTIFYMDTDSIALSGSLADKFVSNKKLGLLKLEHVFNEVVYLAPKVYAGRATDYDYIKVKGSKLPLSFEQIKSLLTKDEKVTIQQEKWYKHIDQGFIKINREDYTLMLTDNKRKLIFDNNGNFINTTPYILNTDKIINKE